ncbi:CaiB/BaiF CoA transferase family protein [Pseudorhodoferax soli]|uniref:Crotonobetainyl-CoA:carnitine CoA-transferase CaiB-like acyl-CoA transferase n=1 Tax=Pseudorhodoferax soli TaxID=545864 RepID=A0A368Y5S6_9BURK|nr:CoA transferase [Pseudorhodoferax soli]RCW75445.1 crotonobetainyl-CoA:carnitine CoA-transferase CaiB-like acyl-CoA transferase [Pseudorhodoferax soli]
MDRSAAQPLKGIRVVEVAQNIAGPYAGEILSALGADVVKVERPGTGDDARGWGPPFWRGTATTFQAMNHGKKSVTLDLKDPADLQWLHGFIAEADVFVQNMRPGALAELQLGPDVLCAANPRLVYCSLTAFGHKGPKQLAPGYEPMVQAYAGLFSINGAENGPPARVGMQVLDLGSGIWAALGCIAALFQRSTSGKGCVVDTSLFETALGWLQVAMAGFQATGQQPARHRSGNPNVVVFQALPTADGELVVAAANDRLFAKLARLVGRAEWASDPRYASNALRVEHKAELVPQLEALFRQRSTADWIAALEGAGIPCGPIQDFAQVMAQPQTEAIGIFQNIPEVDLRVVGLPLSFDGERPPVRGRAPELGEHTQDLRG